MGMLSLVRKAKELKHLVKYNGSGRKHHFFEFLINKSPSVVVEISEQDSTKLVKCTCKFHSVADPQCRSLCSYFLAVLYHLEEKIK